MYIRFSELERGSENREKNLFFCKLNILYVHKKTLIEKKCLCLFNKKTPSYAGLENNKDLATAKQLI